MIFTTFLHPHKYIFLKQYPNKNRGGHETRRDESRFGRSGLGLENFKNVSYRLGLEHFLYRIGFVSIFETKSRLVSKFLFIFWYFTLHECFFLRIIFVSLLRKSSFKKYLRKIGIGQCKISENCKKTRKFSTFEHGSSEQLLTKVSITPIFSLGYSYTSNSQ